MAAALVKPGITCIWQVSGRSDLDFDTWVQMDIQYIEEWTVFGDLRLLGRTIPAVLTGAALTDPNFVRPLVGR